MEDGENKKGLTQAHRHTDRHTLPHNTKTWMWMWERMWDGKDHVLSRSQAQFSAPPLSPAPPSLRCVDLHRARQLHGHIQTCHIVWTVKTSRTGWQIGHSIPSFQQTHLSLSIPTTSRTPPSSLCTFFPHFVVFVSASFFRISLHLPPSITLLYTKLKQHYHSPTHASVKKKITRTTMKFATALSISVLSLSSLDLFASAFVYPSTPVGATVWKPDSTVSISWSDDKEAPLLASKPVFDIFLMTGSDDHQIKLATIATNVKGGVTNSVKYVVPHVSPPGQSMAQALSYWVPDLGQLLRNLGHPSSFRANTHAPYVL